MKAKRLVFPEKMRVDVEEVEIADAPDAGEVLVENLYGLISPGTELAMFTQTHVGFPIPDFRYAKFPFRPGYAAVGRALVVGEGVEGIREGDPIYTRGHHTSHAMVRAGTTTLKLPDNVQFEHAPFAVLAQIALTAVRLSEIRLGHSVSVFGQGLIGNLTAQLMQCAGARQVIGVDRVQARLDIAEKCGIGARILAEAQDAVPRIKDLTDGAGCQVSVEATGDPDVAPHVIRAAAQMGKAVLLGSPRGGAEIDLYFDLHRTGVSLIGAHGSRQADAVRYGDPDPHELMLDFIAQKRLCIAPLITHTLSTAEAQSAYMGLHERKDTYLGILLDLRKWE